MQKLFEQHGVVLVETSTQFKADCPFCGKTGKFYLAKDSSKWDCKVCGRRGNHFTFMNELAALALEHTEKRDYQYLVERKKIPATTLRKFGVAINPLNGNWIIPIHSKPGNVVNIYTWVKETNRMYTTHGMDHSLFMMNLLRKKKPIWICEGHWDAMSLHHLLDRQSKLEKYAVLGVPGANVFREEWWAWLANRDLRFLYDNDDAGQQAIQRMEKAVRENENRKKPKRVSYLTWNGEHPDKYDVGDLITDNTRVGALNYLIRNRIDVDMNRPIDRSDIKHCPTFKALLREFRNRRDQIYFDHSMRVTLAVMMAVVISSRDKTSDPLWLYVIGPPSSGKSMLCEIISGSDRYTERLSKLTDKTLVNGTPGEDICLLPKLDGRCLVVKDFTTVLSMEAGAKEELYGLFRDAYDGSFHRIYGNGVERHYEGFCFTNIFATTEQIRGETRSALGERFICVSIMSENFDTNKRMAASMAKQVESSMKGEGHTITSEMMSYCIGFLDSLLEREEEFRSGDIHRDVLQNHVQWFYDVAEYVARMRSRAQTDFYGDGRVYMEQTEMGNRLANQLVRLAIYLSYVLGKKEVDDEVKGMIVKVAKDTAHGYSMAIAHAIYDLGGRATYRDIGERLNLDSDTVRRKMGDLKHFRLVKRFKGRKNPIMWELDKEVHRLIEQVKSMEQSYD